MKRRALLKSALAMTVASSPLKAQDLGQKLSDAALSLNPVIWPKERDEHREYDHSHPDIVVWKEYAIQASYPPGQILRPVYGFIEALATDKFIPLFRGLLVRPDVPQSKQSGFYFYFGMTLSRIALPRKVQGKPSGDRYTNPYWEHSIQEEPYPVGWVTFDHRKIKLVERARVSMPTGELWYGGGRSAIGEPPLPSVEQVTHYPQRISKHPTVDISGIVRFDITHKPVRFKLELPPLQFAEVSVPLPVCYFEPFDELNKRWV